MVAVIPLKRPSQDQSPAREKERRRRRRRGGRRRKDWNRKGRTDKKKTNLGTRGGREGEGIEWPAESAVLYDVILVLVMLLLIA